MEGFVFQSSFWDHFESFWGFWGPPKNLNNSTNPNLMKPNLHQLNFLGETL